MAREGSDEEYHASEDSDRASISQVDVPKKRKTISTKSKKPPTSIDVPKQGSTMWKLDEQVITLLETVIQWHREKGPPNSKDDKTAYYRFISNKLWEGATRKQIHRKLQALKTSFHGIKNKMVDNNITAAAAAAATASPHELKVFELCKIIWEWEWDKDNDMTTKRQSLSNVADINKNITVTDDMTKPKGKEKEKRYSLELWEGYLTRSEMMDKQIDFCKKYRHLFHSVNETRLVVSDNLFLLGDEKGNELNNRWNELNTKEEIVIRQMRKLEYDQTNLILSHILSPPS